MASTQKKLLTMNGDHGIVVIVVSDQHVNLNSLLKLTVDSDPTT